MKHLYKEDATSIFFYNSDNRQHMIKHMKMNKKKKYKKKTENKE